MFIFSWNSIMYVLNLAYVVLGGFLFQNNFINKITFKYTIQSWLLFLENNYGFNCKKIEEEISQQVCKRDSSMSFCQVLRSLLPVPVSHLNNFTKLSSIWIGSGITLMRPREIVSWKNLGMKISWDCLWVCPFKRKQI